MAGRATGPVIVLSPRVAVYLSSLDESLFRNVTVTVGSIGGIPVIPSHAAEFNIILLDVDRLAIHDGGVDVSRSELAAIQMDDSPTNASATGTGASLVPLWQTGAAAVRLTQYADWRLLGDDAIAFTELTEIGASPA
jgi:hypothetical protein